MASNEPESLPPPTDGEYAGYTLVVFTGIFIPVQIMFVGLRFYARYTLHAWGWDDLIVLVSLVMQLIIGALCIDAVNNAGVGFHVPFLEANEPEKLIVWGKYLIALSVLYFAGVNIPKMAILALYHRIFPTKPIRIAVYVILAILIGLTIGNVVADLAACTPFEANWIQPPPPGARCIDKEAFFIYSSIPNIITDLAILVLPMPVVWNLHTNKRMKVGLLVTFAVGSFGLVTSIIRFHTFFENNSFVDGTFTAVELLIWTQVEAGTYLISACLPTFKPLLERVGLKMGLSGMTRHGGTSDRYGNGDAYGSSFRSKGKPIESSSISNIPLTNLTDVSSRSEGWHRLHEQESAGITVTKDFRVNGYSADSMEK